MKAMVTKYGGVAGRLAGPMSRAQALRLKELAEEGLSAQTVRAEFEL
jgi:hypothetical protein